jgi:hypothetical protein
MTEKRLTASGNGGSRASSAAAKRSGTMRLDASRP